MDKKVIKKNGYTFTYESSSGNFRDVNSQWGEIDVLAQKPVQTPMYDDRGDQIIGQENIKKEIQRRREKWSADHNETSDLSSTSFGGLVGSVKIPLYDNHGQQVNNLQEIQVEIERRRSEWDQAKQEGRTKLTTQRRTLDNGAVETITFEELLGSSELSRTLEKTKEEKNNQICQVKQEQKSSYRIDWK